MIGSSFPSTHPADHRQALKTAGNILIDEFSDDIGRLLAGEEFDDSFWMSKYLPPQFRPKYTALLAKKLLVGSSMGVSGPVTGRDRSPDPA